MNFPNEKYLCRRLSLQIGRNHTGTVVGKTRLLVVPRSLGGSGRRLNPVDDKFDFWWIMMIG